MKPKGWVVAPAVLASGSEVPTVTFGSPLGRGRRTCACRLRISGHGGHLDGRRVDTRIVGPALRAVFGAALRSVFRSVFLVLAVAVAAYQLGVAQSESAGYIALAIVAVLDHVNAVHEAVADGLVCCQATIDENCHSVWRLWQSSRSLYGAWWASASSSESADICPRVRSQPHAGLDRIRQISLPGAYCAVRFP